MNRIVSIVIVAFTFSTAFAQDRIFLEQLPHGFKMIITADSNLIEKGFVLDSNFGENHHYNLYRKEQDVFAYTQKANGKLVMLKIWQIPQSWEEAGISIGMSQWDLTTLLKNQKIAFRQKKFRITNYVYVKWKKLQYEFSFPTLDYTTTAYPQYRDQLQYVVVRLIDHSNKALRGDTAVF